MDSPYVTRDDQFESSDPYLDASLARMDARFDQFEARIGATIDRGFRRLLVTTVSIMVLGFAGTITAALVR